MNKIAQFHKVSFEQFKESWDDSFPGASEEEIKEIYDQIKLPKRATRGSAGYDFFSPVDFELKPGETIKIPTGIRVFIESDWVLNIFPRSGLGFKFRLQMNNTVGIIDSDYFYSDNEGHIFVKLTNDTNEGKTVSVAQGTGMVQGIFMQYGVTIDDDATEQNSYGFVSVKKDGLWGSIDKNGKTIIEPKYNLENNLKIDFIGKWYLGEEIGVNYYCDK